MSGDHTDWCHDGWVATPVVDWCNVDGKALVPERELTARGEG